MGTYISKDKVKICNMCGEDTLVYSVLENAPICQDCKPVDKIKKKIPSESTMINNILKGEKNATL